MLTDANNGDLDRGRESAISRFALLGVDESLLRAADPALLAAIADAVFTPEGDPHDGDERDVAAHANKFSEVFRKAGVGQAGLLRAFRSERRRRPGLTAKDYLSRR